MVDRDILKTLIWSSSWYPNESGVQSAEARVKIDGIGTIDVIKYVLDVQPHQPPPVELQPWTLIGEREVPGYFPNVGQGTASTFALSDSQSVYIPPPAVLYGTLLDWLWNPMMRHLNLTSTPSQSLYNTNIQWPSSWSSNEMSWMIPRV